MENAEALRPNYKKLASAIIRENIRNEPFRRSKWCSNLLVFLDIPSLPPLKPKKEKHGRKFSKEFKMEIAREYDLNIFETPSTLGRKYDITPCTIIRWLDEYSERYKNKDDFVFEE